jgi:hypothetical protein
MEMLLLQNMLLIQELGHMYSVKGLITHYILHTAYVRIIEHIYLNKDGIHFLTSINVIIILHFV